MRGRQRRVLHLRLEQRWKRRRAQVDRSAGGNTSAASFGCRVATYAPRGGRDQLPLPLLLEELLLFQEMKLQNKRMRSKYS